LVDKKWFAPSVKIAIMQYKTDIYFTYSDAILTEAVYLYKMKSK
jgi:hypothetical protein